ncbi:MAG TPA: ThuA domain-containing protein [Bryobacteraceae bacterium]|nr:ThuA domain-containing protein [Bryobacteraceae bacterium]
MKQTLLALLIAVCALAQTQPVAQPKIQTLIIAGQNGHDWRGTTPLLRKALEDTGRFEVRVVEEFRGAGPETLAPYDLIVVNYYESRKPALKWGERAESAFLNHIKSGKGLVIYHFSVAAFDGWAEYEKMCAGNWRPNNGHHSAGHEFTVDIKDANHPITKGLKKSFPQSKDELYANLKWQPEGTYHVLATAYDDHSLYKNAKQPIPGAGIDQPMLWTTQYGQGKVFTTVLGHDIPAVSTPAFIVTFVRGAEWAATGNVTIPIPPEMAQ